MIMKAEMLIAGWPGAAPDLPRAQQVYLEAALYAAYSANRLGAPPPWVPARWLLRRAAIMYLDADGRGFAVNVPAAMQLVLTGERLQGVRAHPRAHSLGWSFLDLVAGPDEDVSATPLFALCFELAKEEQAACEQ